MKMICPAAAMGHCDEGCVGYGWPIAGYHNQPHTKKECGTEKACSVKCKPCADNGELALLCPNCGEPITQANVGSFKCINSIVTGVICGACMRKIQAAQEANISIRTLETLDEAADNFKKGNVGPTIELDKYLDEEKDGQR